MSHQIIKQPNGLYGVFSSLTETWIVYDATDEELIQFYEVQAALKAREETERILEAVIADAPEAVYAQFAMSFDEANLRHNLHADPVPFAE